MTVLEYVENALIGKACTFEGDVYAIKKVTVERGQMSVSIENADNSYTVDMDSTQMINAVRAAS